MHMASRYHDFSAGHRVHGHESKCAHLHGHNYRVHFDCAPSGARSLDAVGRVIDFSVIKDKLCQWLEDNWDHKFLVSDEDPIALTLYETDPAGVVLLPFNPTAENMAEYLVEIIGPEQLRGTGVQVIACRVEETRKCTASFVLPAHRR